MTILGLRKDILTGVDLGPEIYFKNNYLYDSYDLDYKKFLGKYTISVPKLNVRSGPGISYPKIGALQSGDIIEVTEVYNSKDDLWQRINFNDQIGFVAESLLDTIP